MGNRHGNQRQKDAKAKEEKQKEKEAKKEQEKRKKREKKTKERGKLGQHVSEWDTDAEESSHLTGGDSESCVFHSAENVSVSPYLDSCTRSELEQGAAWSGMLEVYPSALRHPQVLSSKDFKDGFSLEACLPPDIARLDGYAEMSSSATSRYEGHSSGSVKSKRSNSSVKSSTAYRSRHVTPTTPRSQHGDDASSLGTSSQISGNEGGGYSTPLLSTPVFQREERCHSPTSASAALTRVEEAGRDDSVDIIRSPSASSSEHHHFDGSHHLQRKCNQQRQDISDFRILAKPSSPHPQRRALSPKVTTSPFKIISSDDSSSSPTTPVPQRRAATFLDIFRSGSRSERGKKIKSTERLKDTGLEQTVGKGTSGTTVKEKVKSKPLWKTWERSSIKKGGKQSNVSIFGTARKTDQKCNTEARDSIKEAAVKEKTKVEKVSGMITEALSKLDDDVDTKSVNQSQGTRTISSSKLTVSVDSKTSKAGSENLDTHLEYSLKAVGDVEGNESNRNSSPPTVKSAAFCIMKLEELEKSIEKTIREKFPDAGPLLLKNRSKEDELRGSRSLPTTPSLQKKLYVAREMNMKRENQQLISSCSKGTTRYCDETYESSPSPAMSPVVLRRFGARTRHASISPKIQRAKTAALYSSPSEMSRVEESFATKTVTRVPIYHAVSSQQPQTPVSASKFVKPLTAAQKSESKYDNIMDESDYPVLTQTSTIAHLVRQEGVDEDDSDEIEECVPFSDNGANSCQKPVIVPTFSAVFGSVSPKLKRHFETKCENINKDEGTAILGGVTIHVRPERHTKHKNDHGRTVGDYADPGISLETESVSSNTSLVEPLSVSSLGTALSSKKRRPGGHLTHDDDGHKPGVRLTKQIATEAAKVNNSQTVAETNAATLSTGSGPMSVKVHCKTINTFQCEESAPSKVYAHAALDAVVSSLPHNSTGKIHKGETGAAPSFPDQRNMDPGTISHLPTQRDIFKAKERNTTDSMSSPASTHKHSTDHVVFGSAVALPCRLYASLPGPETINGVNNSPIAHAPSTLLGQSENSWNAKKEKSAISTENEPALQSPASEQLTTASNSVITRSALVPVSSELQVVRSLFDPRGSAAVYNAKQTSGTAGDVGLSKVEVFLSESSASTVTTQSSNKSDVLRSLTHNKQPEYHPPIKGHQTHSLFDNQVTHRQDEQNFVLHRQPVSQVISEMINVSKEQKQQPHQPKHQRPKQRQHHQSNPASPDHGIKLVKPTVAMVTTPPYEQPCLTLEEKTVSSGSSISLPSSPTNDTRIEKNSECEKEFIFQGSRSQEIQTDSYTTADKGVDSGGLMQSVSSFYPSITPTPITRKMDIENSENDKGVQKAEIDDSDGSEFLKIVLACKKNSAQRDKEAEGAFLCDAGSKHVPPPSPTAMEKLIEEYNEEGEDDEAIENKETESEIRRELEMKRFTDTIYKRLSDLLGSSHSGAENDLDDDVFEDDNVSKKRRNVHELLSKLEGSGDGFSSNDDDSVSHFPRSSSALPSGKTLGQAKVLTIETSSSLTTTTSSDSDVYEPLQAFQALHTSEPRTIDDFKGTEDVFIQKKEPNVFVFPEFDNNQSLNSDDARQRRSSREYHSDDDVATGRGIPDYYDDRPLWSRRQKPPGQLSAAMMAIRRRERRERWLRKRRRNRTDLISTGSSDTGSDMYSRRDPPLRGSSNDNEDDEVVYFDKTGKQHVMGPVVLTVPKYSKPILPFFDSARMQCADDIDGSVTDKICVKRHQVSCYYREVDSRSNSEDDKYQHRKHAKDKKKKDLYDDDEDNVDDYDKENRLTTVRNRLDSNLAIPGIEETFNELMSVQNILEEMQDKTPTSEGAHLMPLTTENVKSMRDFYKDCYSGGNGRRSRMSATDRTESDLDIYSETRDDVSSDSDVYADDEEDDDKFEPYATADDELGAAGGSSSAPCGSKHGEVHRGENDDDSDTNFVVGCTFYNSNAYPPTSAAELVTTTVSNARPTPLSTSAPHTPQAVLNSDEEFWAGGAAIEESYKQLESVADAVSSTFQNAREQMHDIQHHLQALRRQMEVLQDDLISTSITMTPDVSMGSTGK